MTDTAADLRQIARYVDRGDFSGLFISELGWDNPPDPRAIRYAAPEKGSALTATPVASKRGVVVYHCDSLPSRNDVEGLDRLISRRSAERLLIFTSDDEQQWRWPEPRKAGGTRYATHSHIAGDANPALYQRLNAVRFDLDEERSLTVLAVRQRVRASFNADEVTKRFYNEFRDTQQELMGDIAGIPSEDERSWYSSLLLNRLMFIYFMQRKGFLNDDVHYLRNSLKGVQRLNGENRFFDYYRDFLIPLFHEGLGAEHDKYEDENIAQLIGDVPYINGGIFAPHLLEARYDISVSDAMFDSIFDFFDRYRWHLDERPTGDPTEINPEVLGHIFEKYVNQKVQGAYYTKEDVTGYMTALALLPAVIDRLTRATGKTPWHLLTQAPNRYIPEALRHGTNGELPKEVLEEDPFVYGILDAHAPMDLALPEERWRELLDRRAYNASLQERLVSGGVSTTDEVVTLNLDLQTLITDWISEMTEPMQIGACWDALTDLKVVDPTCGSGAFLFASLDILEELYEATLAQMERVSDAEENRRLAEVIEDVSRHGSRSYYLLKTAVLSNIYGVDIMEEATEIARLRLFLALVARLERRSEVEPLPDLDMNIRVGNLLVGCSTAQDAVDRFAGSLLDLRQVEAIDAQAIKSANAYRNFVEAQRTNQNARIVNQAKDAFASQVDSLRQDLDVLYSPQNGPGKAFDDWRALHHPFHWFIEFPEVFEGGGFDVVLGNPPYISKSKVPYSYSGLRTQASPDVFGPCLERSSVLTCADGRFAMIVPIAFQFSDRQSITRAVMTDTFSSVWCSTYGLWPSSLFTGVGVRNTIVVGSRSGSHGVNVTGFRRFHRSFRPYLFDTNRYVRLSPERDMDEPWPRLPNEGCAVLFERLSGRGTTLGESIDGRGQHSLSLKSTAADFLSVFIDMPPAWDLDGRRVDQTAVNTLKFRSEIDRDLAYVVIAGRLALWWWVTLGDDFNVTQSALKSIPVGLKDLGDAVEPLLELASALRVAQPRNPFVTKKMGRLYGNYNLNSDECRAITDESDQIVLGAVGLGHHWPDVLLADAAYQKATSESGSTRRVWPFDWELGRAG